METNKIKIPPRFDRAIDTLLHQAHHQPRLAAIWLTFLIELIGKEVAPPPASTSPLALPFQRMLRAELLEPSRRVPGMVEMTETGLRLLVLLDQKGLLLPSAEAGWLPDVVIDWQSFRITPPTSAA
jgi:hypothetical protein